ncbi:AAA family ATPase [Yoonia sp. BS5-3]|uniref:AAA family ATPase n=1 Tax=Yoonia phaeophyticola TaxID=3137369 RepID=A0ABZ2V826_9RHOB
MTDDDWRALRFHAADLFTPSSPVTTTELFAGRASQIDKLVEAVAERGRHAILFGEPGVGKTSIAKLLQYFVPRGLKSVQYVRKAVVSTDTFTSIWENVFRSIKFQAHRDGIYQEYNVADLYPDNISPSDVVRELNYFGESVIPIIVIDEFQQLKDEEAARLMSETVKAVSDEGTPATIVVVGVGDNVDDLVRGHGSIIRCSEEVLMPRMKTEEIQLLLNQRIEQLGMTLSGDAKWKITGLSKGLPSFAHALGRASVYSAIDRQSLNVAEEDIDNGILTAIESSQHTLKSAYETATNSNQARATFRQLLTACALTKTDASGWFTPKDVEQPFSGIIGEKRTVEYFNGNLTDFASDKRGDILQQKGTVRNFRFRFTEPAMQPYVLMKGIQAGIIPEDAMSALSSPEQGELFAI